MKIESYDKAATTLLSDIEPGECCYIDDGFPYRSRLFMVIKETPEGTAGYIQAARIKGGSLQTFRRDIAVTAVETVLQVKSQ